MEAPRYPDFAARLKSARLRSGKSQERIAVEVGTSRRHWIRWERGEHLPSPEFLARIGEATGQPDAFIFDEGDEDARSMGPLSRDEYAMYGELTARIVAAKMAAPPAAKVKS